MLNHPQLVGGYAGFYHRKLRYCCGDHKPSSVMWGKLVCDTFGRREKLVLLQPRRQRSVKGQRITIQIAKPLPPMIARGKFRRMHCEFICIALILHITNLLFVPPQTSPYYRNWSSGWYSKFVSAHEWDLEIKSRDEIRFEYVLHDKGIECDRDTSSMK